MCGVSSLGMDHTQILGDTVEKIAWQKGGIFKVGGADAPVLATRMRRSLHRVCVCVCVCVQPGVPAFTVRQPEGAMAVLRDRALEAGVSVCPPLPPAPPPPTHRCLLCPSVLWGCVPSWTPTAAPAGRCAWAWRGGTSAPTPRWPSSSAATGWGGAGASGARPRPRPRPAPSPSEVSGAARRLPTPV